MSHVNSGNMIYAFSNELSLWYTMYSLFNVELYIGEDNVVLPRRHLACICIGPMI